MNNSINAIRKRLHTQDNRMTRDPIFMVQELSLDSEWMTITVCFTNEAALDYIEQDKHNLGHTRIYVACLHHNREMIAIRDFLMSMVDPIVIDKTTLPNPFDPITDTPPVVKLESNCPKCGLDGSKMTGYVCGNQECPWQARIIC